MARGMMGWFVCWAVLGMLGAAGCNKYATPGPGADMKLFAGGSTLDENQDVITDPEAREIVECRPVASIPANLVAVRVQGSGYQSHTQIGYGSGNYCVLTIQDIETEKDFERIGKLPQIAQVGRLNRLLLPKHLESDQELRNAALQLQADMLLIYTIETDFYIGDDLTPVSIFTLGLSPHVWAKVFSTASLVLMDVKTGFIYGAADGNAKKEQLANHWTSGDAVDQCRRQTEREAFVNLLAEFEKMWPTVAENQLKRLNP